MRPSNDNPDHKLYDALTEQGRLYKETLPVAQQVHERLARGEDATELLAKISESMSKVARMESEIRGLRSQVPSSEIIASREMQSVVDENRQIIEKLLAEILPAEQLARQAKERLAPTIDARTRGLQMRKAYSAASNVS